MRLSEKKLASPIATYRISASITSNLLGMENDANGDVIVLHRINDEPVVRKARLRQDKRGEHYFRCCGDRLYIADYRPPKPARLTSKVYRYH